MSRGSRNRAAEGASQLGKAAEKQIKPELQAQMEGAAAIYRAADEALSSATTAEEVAHGYRLLEEADEATSDLGYEPPPR